MIYEFKCEKCNRITTETLPITSQKKKTICQFCGEVAIRMISKNSFILKGKGWSKDGYNKE
jgi:putative FmdB family regulatory protein